MCLLYENIKAIPGKLETIHARMPAVKVATSLSSINVSTSKASEKLNREINGRDYYMHASTVRCWRY